MLPGLRETVEKHGLLASKALGQNFLLDRNITDKIIRLSLNRQGLSSFAGSNVCEIGPGPGGLTRAVLEAAPASLTVIEMDPRCIAIMEELKEQTNVPFRIVNGDALTFDLSREIEAPRQLVSNLPYNVSVPLLTGWLKQAGSYRAMTLMFQKEVAERITAPTRCKDYGRLSVLAQLNCRRNALPRRRKSVRQFCCLLRKPKFPLPKRWQKSKKSPRSPSASGAKCCAKA